MADIGGTRARVLVVEDNPVNQQLMIAQLDALGLAGSLATTGREAIELVFGQHFDIILMDFSLPDVHGLTVARRLRAADIRRANGAPIGIVAVTAHATDRDREASIAAGMDDFLPKPVSMETLRTSIERLLAGSGPATAAVAAPERGPTPAQLSSDGLDDAVIGDLLEQIGDAETVAAIIDVYLGELPRRLAAADAAVAARDASALADIVHTLKSSSALLGATRLADRCARIERLATGSDPEAFASVSALGEACRLIESSLDHLRRQLRTQVADDHREA